MAWSAATNAGTTRHEDAALATRGTPAWKVVLASSRRDACRAGIPPPAFSGDLPEGCPENCADPAIMILNCQPNPAASLGVEAQEELNRNRTGGKTMAWTTPTIVEVCVGMEVTAYSSAEI